VVATTALLAPNLMAPLARRTLRLEQPDASSGEKLDVIAGAVEWVRRHRKAQGAAA
jgi:hypothetical protein